jgi:hypothetical protein
MLGRKERKEKNRKKKGFKHKRKIKTETKGKV